MTINGRSVDFTVANALLFAGAIVFSIWLFCLQCAGAALSYEARGAQAVVRKKAVEAAHNADVADIGDLLRARMPKKSH